MVALVAAVALTLGLTSLALANLVGSTFESGDGNLLVNAPGNEDWASVGISCPTSPGFGPGCGVDEPSGTADNSFGQGTKEDVPAVTVVAGSIPPNKNDLTRFYEFSETKTINNAPHLLVYLAWERLVNIGSANLDFEINQNPTAGFTASSLGAVTLNRTPGDLLVTYDFGGSGTPDLGILTWETAATPVPTYWNQSTNICFSSNKAPTSAGCWADRLDLSAIGAAEGAINAATVCDPIAPLPSGATACTKDGSTGANQLTTGLFGEAGVDLTAAHIVSSNQCQSFGSVFVKSRSSTSFTAEIKDFIAPVPVSIRTCGAQMSTAPSVGSNTIVTPGTAVSDGATVTVTSNGANATPPLGTVTFYVCGPTSSAVACTTSGTNLGTVSLSGSPGTATSATTSPTAGGVYCFLAQYNPDPSLPSSLATSDSDTATECFAVQASPTVTTSLSATTVNLGASVTDSATLHNATTNAGGTLTYNAYGPALTGAPACSGTPAFTSTVNVSNGSVPNSAAFTPSGAGYYSWQAVYSGDAGNVGNSSDCTTETVLVKASPTVATTLSTTSIVLGTGSVTDSATLSGATSNAGGSVTYNVYGPGASAPACTGSTAFTSTKTVTNGSVPASDAFTPTAAGFYSWQAVYTGDTLNNGASSVCSTETLVVKSPSAIATTESVIPDDTATLSSVTANAGGSITFNLYSPADSTCSGTPAFTQTVSVAGPGSYSTTNHSSANPVVATATGVWRWAISYTGDGENVGSQSTCGTESFTITY